MWSDTRQVGLRFHNSVNDLTMSSAALDLVIFYLKLIYLNKFFFFVFFIKKKKRKKKKKKKRRYKMKPNNKD